MNNSMRIDDKSFKRIEKVVAEDMNYVKHSIWKDIGRELISKKVAMISLIVLVIIIICALLAPLSPYDPYEVDAGQKLLEPSISHWFGTDEYGRDYFTRILYGGRVSLLVGLCSMLITIVIGSTIGVCAGYLGGKVDMILMRFTDIFLALPSMLLMIILNTLLQPNLGTLIIVLSIFSWPSVARITRSETMSVKEREYVLATEYLGASNMRIAVKHIIPNIMGSIVVAASLGVANAILMESSLSFLGLGVQIPVASWGSMLQSAQTHILNHPLLALYPGLFILITVLGFNLLGDVLRNALEPKVVI